MRSPLNRGDTAQTPCAIDAEGPRIVQGGWLELCANLENLDMTLLDDARERFTSCVIDSTFGDLRIRNVGSRGGALRGERSPSRINRVREDLIWICLVMVGTMKLTQNRATALLGPGDLAIIDAAQTYALDLPSAPIDTLWIGSPRGLIDGHIWDVEELLGQRIDGAAGAGQIASRILQAAFASGVDAPQAGANRIAHGMLDVLGAAADSCRLRQAGSQYRGAVVRRIKSYIDDHLGDETLTVARIAQAQGVSPRYLAKMFEAETESVSSWIWSRRLERCRLALMNASGGTSVSEIAYAHGFKNVSHFSRVFKERYGHSPSAVFRGDATARLPRH